MPFWPDGFRSERVGWEDVHPGWRFLRILDWFVDQRTPVSAPERYGEMTDAWMHDLQERICDDLSWPAPASLSSEWRTALTQWEAHGDTLGVFIQDDADRLRMSVELLATRQNRASQAVLAYVNPTGKARHWFAGIAAADSWDPYVNEGTMEQVQSAG